MKPDRSNYEIWMIDWLDGKLDETQIRQLLLFLDVNPDLKEDFYFYSDIELNPPSEKFLYKEALKKVPSDITGKQFEYLCAGYVENDLSDEQIEELEAIVSDSVIRKNELELFKQTILAAPDIRFGNKRKLLRTTPFQKALRISVAALSTAASIAIFIVASQFIGKTDLPVTPDIIASKTVSDSVEIIVPSAEKIAEMINILPVNQIPQKIEKDENNATDSVHITFPKNHLEPIEIPNLLSINISAAKDYQSSILLSSKTASNTSGAPPKNLAQLFREKALKEETPDNSPIKTYEIAAAGIKGLNRLFGWEMDFRKNRDENGEIKTLYFSSKLLTAQIPVNKSE